MSYIVQSRVTESGGQTHRAVGAKHSGAARSGRPLSAGGRARLILTFYAEPSQNNLDQVSMSLNPRGRMLPG